jgi:hypothetical protein
MTGLTLIGNVFLRVSLCAQKQWNRNGSSQSDIQPLRAALESMVFEHQGSMLIHFVGLFVWLTKSQMTSLAALRHAEFALNGGSICIISCNSQNDWFPWGNCMTFMPSLECNLKSGSLFIVSDISQNDCFLEEECLTLKSLACDWFKELGYILIVIQKSEWLLSLRKLFGIYALVRG